MVQEGGCPFVFILGDLEEAGYFYHDLTQILGTEKVLFFPSSFRRSIKYGQKDAANEILRTEVRAAVCSDCATARLVKEHNNANIIAFGARIVGTELAKDIVKAYLDAEFSGGRHQTRIDLIHEIEERNE